MQLDFLKKGACFQSEGAISPLKPHLSLSRQSNTSPGYHEKKQLKTVQYVVISFTIGIAVGLWLGVNLGEGQTLLSNPFTNAGLRDTSAHIIEEGGEVLEESGTALKQRGESLLQENNNNDFPPSNTDHSNQQSTDGTPATP